MLDFEDDRDDLFESDDLEVEELDLDLDFDLELESIEEPLTREQRIEEFENLVADIVTWIRADKMATGPGNRRGKKVSWT